MQKKPASNLVLALAANLFVSGCFVQTQRQQAYFVNPFNGNNLDYHALPQRTDSAKKAVYVQGGFFAGGANEKGTDGVSGGKVSAYVARHAGPVQFYYGADLSLGEYTNGRWDTTYQNAFFFIDTRQLPPQTATHLNGYTGSRFMGGVGYCGGINLVMPMGQGEWRYLGVETAFHHEFGDYLSFRRKLPDSLARLIVRNPFFGTVGLTTEMIGRTRGGEYGFRLAHGWNVSSPYTTLTIFDSLSNHKLHYRYTTFSFHYTYSRYTWYVQFETGAEANTFHAGFAYRFGQPRLPAKRFSQDAELRRRQHWEMRPRLPWEKISRPAPVTPPSNGGGAPSDGGGASNGGGASDGGGASGGDEGTSNHGGAY